MRRLLFLRHGRTWANESRLYLGRNDPHLSPLGRKELQALVETGIYPRAGVYFTSGMLRTDETLSLIAPKAVPTRLPGLREMDFGEFELFSYEDLKYDPRYLLWILDKTGEIPCPGGESKNWFQRRVIRTLCQIVPCLPSTSPSMVVCHGGVICAAMEFFFPGEKKYFDWQPDFGLGYQIQLDLIGRATGYQPFEAK